MDEQTKRLRAAVAALGPRKRGRRIPSSVRAMAVSFATRGRARGLSWAALSREAGLSSESLRRWTGAADVPRDGVSVVPVTVRARDDDEPRQSVSLTTGATVAAAKAVASRSASGASSLVLVSPRGFRLEGLGLGEAHLLLEALS